MEKTEFPHSPRPKIQPGGEKHLRQVPGAKVPDIEKEPLKFLTLALVHLRNAFVKVPTMLQDFSRPVDEYNNQSLAPEGETQITLNPQWEVPERIESVLITGPAAAAITVELGDRVWNLVIPAAGFIFIGAPLNIYLGRQDPRILTAQTPGQFSFELMGHADTRGNMI